MATKLKNMRLTSVDMVRAGANQEADICLFKSADPTEAPESPTEGETNILKRFLDWLQKGAGAAAEEQETPVEKDYSTFDTLNSNRENSEKLWRYTDALTTSIRSIQDDHDLDKEKKLELMLQSLDEFDAAMEDLIDDLCRSATVGKSDDEIDPEVEEEEEEAPAADIDEIEEV